MKKLLFFLFLLNFCIYEAKSVNCAECCKAGRAVSGECCRQCNACQGFGDSSAAECKDFPE